MDLRGPIPQLIWEFIRLVGYDYLQLRLIYHSIFLGHRLHRGMLFSTHAQWKIYRICLHMKSDELVKINVQRT